MRAELNRPSRRGRLAGTTLVIAALLALAYLGPGSGVLSVRSQTLPSADSSTAGSTDLTYYAYGSFTPGQDLVLQANPSPNDPATQVTVTIPGDQVTSSGTAVLSTGLNNDGSVSGMLSSGPPDATGTACLGADAGACINITLDDGGSATFALMPSQ
jgi:hypothetical protein